MKKITKEWLFQAIADLESADLLFKHKRHLHAIYFCQQCLEKTIKGIIAEQTAVPPPYAHQLLLLYEKIPHKPELSAPYVTLLVELSKFYIPTRYPGYKKTLSKTLTPVRAASYVKQTKDMHQWLNSLI